VACDGGDLRLGAADQGQPGDGRAAQVVERDANDAGPIDGLAPRRSESRASPRCVVGARQNNGTLLRLCGLVQRGLERRPDRDGDSDRTPRGFTRVIDL
jgi:hypothetical protein